MLQVIQSLRVDQVELGIVEDIYLHPIFIRSSNDQLLLVDFLESLDWRLEEVTLEIFLITLE